MPGALKSSVLALAFALEIAVLLAVAQGVASFLDAAWAAWLAGAAAAVLWAGLWGAFASPRAPRPLPGPARVAFEVVWVGGGVAALLLSDHLLLAVWLAALWIVTALLVRAWGLQHDPGTPSRS